VKIYKHKLSLNYYEEFQHEVKNKKMDELELDQIIMFLRGNLSLKDLLKYVRIDGFGKERDNLKYSLQQLIDLQEKAYIGYKFQKNFGRGKKRDKYLQQIKTGKKTLEDFKDNIPKTTFYRLKKDLIKT